MVINAYEGNQPYIFISYAHKNSNIVIPIIESLIASGFRVWYDAGIEAGTEWPEYIATKLSYSACVIAFISRAALDSQNCRREINYAISEKKEMLSVYLEDVELSKGMAMQLGTTQGMFFYRLPWEDFIKELIASSILAPCSDKVQVVITNAPKSTPAISPLFKKALMFLEDEDYTQADVYFDRVLDNEPENGEAYLGKLMASLHINSENLLKDVRNLNESPLFRKALQYSSDNRKEQLTQYAVEGNRLFRIQNGKLVVIDKNITECIIPNDITYIDSSTFRDCIYLAKVTIPNNVTGIGNYAFSGCQNLTNIILPDNLTSIGNYAFSGCEKLTGISIPDSTTLIGEGAFFECFNLSKIIIGNNVSSIGNKAFHKCTNLISISIPDSTNSIGNEAFYNCQHLEKVTIGNGIMSIGFAAFYGCASLSNIMIPKGVTSISANIFEGCTSLTSIAIPNGVTSISNAAFRGCSSLTSITFPNNVKSIGEDAFYECTSLTNITIPEGVTSIDSGAFYACEKLTNITIPNSVKGIGESIFQRCTSLTSITIPDGLTSIAGWTFEKCTRLTSITIPDSVKSIGESAFRECKSLTNIIIPNRVTSIGNCAFFGCESLTSVTIPDSVTHIGDEAFWLCRGLTSLKIGNGITSVGKAAFGGLTNIKTVVGGRGLEKIESSVFKYSPNLQNKGGCYIATCIYGSYDCPEVWTLRRYRDERLGTSRVGRLFIRLYYAVSPTLVKWFGHTKWFPKLFKKRLDKMVKELQNKGFDNTPYEDKLW